MDYSKQSFSFSFSDAVVVREKVGEAAVGTVTVTDKPEDASVALRLDGETLLFDFVIPQAPLDEKAAFLAAHPVGSFYFSESSFSPAEYYGGTWESVDGKFLYACGGGIEGGITGGQQSVTLTVDNLPSHSHASKGYAMVTDGSGSYVVLGGTGLANTYGTGDTGSGKPFSIMPPYLSVYGWKRTA